MVATSDDAVEVNDECLGLGAERVAELNQHRQRRIPRTSLDLRQVSEADACALGESGLSKPEPLSQFAHARTEHEAYSP